MNFKIKKRDIENYTQKHTEGYSRQPWGHKYIYHITYLHTTSHDHIVIFFQTLMIFYVNHLI